jgi:hypothetical protein
MCKAFARSIAIMGIRFIIGATLVGGGFRGIPILMHLGFKRKI